MENFNLEVKSASLVDQVEDLIYRYIRENQMVPGTPLPNEHELAEKLKVGRNVLREALSRLRMLGIIESKARKGMVLSEPNIMNSLSKVINPYLLNHKTILDLLSFRVSLEVGISELIISNITDENIAELEKIISRHEYQEDMKLKIENEIEFHVVLYQATKNQSIIDFLTMVLPLFNFTFNNFEDFKSINEENRNNNRLIKHEDLIIYLRNRDVDGYRKAIYDHLKAYSQYVSLVRKKQNNENEK